MRMKNLLHIRILFLLVFNIFYTECNNIPKKGIPIKPEIIHLQDTYYSKFYLFTGFKENEECIKLLFDFIKTENGHLDVITDKNSVKFEDGYSIDDSSSVRFAFSRENDSQKNNYIRVNFLKEKKVFFSKEEKTDTILLLSDFSELNLNTLQNFLEYAQKDDNKKKHKAYTYELYNKDKVKKAVLTYHNYGEWFSVDIL